MRPNVVLIIIHTVETVPMWYSFYCNDAKMITSILLRWRHDDFLLSRRNQGNFLSTMMVQISILSVLYEILIDNNWVVNCFQHVIQRKGFSSISTHLSLTLTSFQTSQWFSYDTKKGVTLYIKTSYYMNEISIQWGLPGSHEFIYTEIFTKFLSSMSYLQDFAYVKN